MIQRDYLERHSRLVVALLLLAAVPLVASAGHGLHPGCCPDCGDVACVPSFATVKETNHSWSIECKQICIPHIRLPWQSCCELPKCGRVKTVKVLKKVEYECEKCGCKWDVKQVGCEPCGVCRQ